MPGMLGTRSFRYAGTGGLGPAQSSANWPPAVSAETGAGYRSELGGPSARPPPIPVGTGPPGTGPPGPAPRPPGALPTGTGPCGARGGVGMTTCGGIWYIVGVSSPWASWAPWDPWGPEAGGVPGATSAGATAGSGACSSRLTGRPSVVGSTGPTPLAVGWRAGPGWGTARR